MTASFLLTPLIFLPNLLLLCRGEIIFDVEQLANLFRSLSFDHVRHSLASNVQESFDVKVVGSQDYIKKYGLVYTKEFLVPCKNVVRPLLTGIILIRWWGIVLYNECNSAIQDFNKSSNDYVEDLIYINEIAMVLTLFSPYGGCTIQ